MTKAPDEITFTRCRPAFVFDRLLENNNSTVYMKKNGNKIIFTYHGRYCNKNICTFSKHFFIYRNKIPAADDLILRTIEALK